MEIMFVIILAPSKSSSVSLHTHSYPLLGTLKIAQQCGGGRFLCWFLGAYAGSSELPSGQGVSWTPP